MRTLLMALALLAGCTRSTGEQCMLEIALDSEAFREEHKCHGDYGCIKDAMMDQCYPWWAPSPQEESRGAFR